MLESIEKLEFIWFFFSMYLFVAVIRVTIADFTFDHIIWVLKKM